MPAEISPESVMAFAILVATQANKPVLIEEVSGLFATLREKHLQDVGSVALRRIPHGLYSEDVEAFFGRLLAGGFAQAFSPLKVNARGLDLCTEMVNEERASNPEGFNRVADTLGFNFSVLSCQVHQGTLA
jgi:hypothetical protein